MNGRIYDPLLGRFLSADIVVQNPGDLQAFNRYSYVLNRPLTMIDPTGFFWDFSKLTDEQRKKFEADIATRLAAKGTPQSVKDALGLIASSTEVGVQVAFAVSAAAKHEAAGSASNVDRNESQKARPNAATGQLDSSNAAPAAQVQSSWSGFEVRKPAYTNPPPEGAVVRESPVVKGAPTARKDGNSITVNFEKVEISPQSEKGYPWVLRSELKNDKLCRHEQVHREINKRVMAEQTTILRNTRLTISSGGLGGKPADFVKPAVDVIVFFNQAEAGERQSTVNSNYDAETQCSLDGEAQKKYDTEYNVK